MVTRGPRPEGLLQNIITYICFKAKLLSTIKLVKLVYLVDVYHAQMFGDRLTQSPFKHHYYGVWAPDIGEELEKLCSMGIIKDAPVTTRAGYVASVPKPAVKRATVSLPDTAVEALEAVIADWGLASSDEVVKYTKSTLPFLGTPFGALIDFHRTDFATEYAEKRGITPEEAATEDILGDHELLDALTESQKELRRGKEGV